MKYIKYIIAIVLILTLVSSCKSKKNLIKNSNSNITTTQVITQIDTTKWIREILDIINKQVIFKDKSIITTTNITKDTITTTKNDIELLITVDVNKNETIKEFRDSHSTDSTTNIAIIKNKEELNETKDNRPVQGIEWVYVIITCVVVLGLVIIYIIRKNR